jgi:hypothetical protein
MFGILQYFYKFLNKQLKLFFRDMLIAIGIDNMEYIFEVRAQADGATHNFGEVVKCSRELEFREVAVAVEIKLGEKVFGELVAELQGQHCDYAQLNIFIYIHFGLSQNLCALNLTIMLFGISNFSDRCSGFLGSGLSLNPKENTPKLKAWGRW